MLEMAVKSFEPSIFRSGRSEMSINVEIVRAPMAAPFAGQHVAPLERESQRGPAINILLRWSKQQTSGFQQQLPGSFPSLQIAVRLLCFFK
jgi:hypothetical protein